MIEIKKIRWKMFFTCIFTFICIFTYIRKIEKNNYVFSEEFPKSLLFFFT